MRKNSDCTNSSTPEPPGLKKRVEEILSSQGLPSHTPCIKLEISGGESESFCLDKEDLIRVFSQFGEVRSLKILDSIALILFEDITGAYLAQKILNGKHLGKIALKVSWYFNMESSPEPAIKYTCQFEIQIPIDKDFQVARRLIGPKGNNMKRIVNKCSKKRPGHDVIKIRLRGKGSGFKEGPNNQESDEPLHLCVSSKLENKYNLAVKHIEKLLSKVYKDYAVFCRKKQLPVHELKVKKSEQVTGKLSKTSAHRLEELKTIRKLGEIEIKELVGIRNEARRQSNFAQADEIRDLLKTKGIALIDEKGARGKGGEVTSWKALKSY